jgi:hypothetical protein
MDQQRVKMRAADPNQLALDAVSSGITTDDLVRWLTVNARPEFSATPAPT